VNRRLIVLAFTSSNVVVLLACSWRNYSSSHYGIATACIWSAISSTSYGFQGSSTILYKARPMQVGHTLGMGLGLGIIFIFLSILIAIQAPSDSDEANITRATAGSFAVHNATILVLFSVIVYAKRESLCDFPSISSSPSLSPRLNPPWINRLNRKHHRAKTTRKDNGLLCPPASLAEYGFSR
jgi:hypothetical protein